jgi:predicted HicB family RNase H-like nuclease
MPNKGQKSVALKEDVYLKAEQKAKEQNKSVSKWVSEIIVQKCRGS